MASTSSQTAPAHPRLSLTLEDHMMASTGTQPGASRGLTSVITAIGAASSRISATLRSARLVDVLGELDSDNIQGERQQKLDVIANDIMKDSLSVRSGIAILGSEEDDQLIELQTQDVDGERFAVLFDPLDGSSNLDVAGGVGTIFCVFKTDPADPARLSPGRLQLAAGYVLYGSSTLLVMTTGNGVNMFVLDPTTGLFIRVQRNLKIPQSGKLYSVNEANMDGFPDGFRRYLLECHEQGYSARYAGAMVADVHRVLLKGGIFLYPPTSSAPTGKLRLMYECNPMAMIVTQAGGLASTGQTDILQVQPEQLHQRVPVAIGSPDNVRKLLAML